MKELFIIKTSENDFIKQCAARTIVVPDGQIYRDCLYVACVDSEKFTINYFARILDVQFKEAEEGDPDGKNGYVLHLKVGSLIKMSRPLDFSAVQDFPSYLTFEELLSESIDLHEVVRKQKKMTKREVSLVVARYLEQGVNYSLNQKLDDAMDLFNLALDIDKNNYLIYFYLGNVYVDRAKLDIAQYYYKKSIELNPKFHHAYNYLGLAYSYLSKSDKAIDCWQQSITLSPKDEFALTNLGKAFIQTKQYQKALETLNTAAEINPANNFIYNLIGVAHANLGNLDNAIENWTKIVEAGQDDEYLHLNLARAYYESQRYRESLEEYELIQGMFPAGHELHTLADQNIDLLREKLSDKTVVINDVKEVSPYFEHKFGISLPDIDAELTKVVNFNKLADYITLFGLSGHKIKSIVFDRANEADAVDYDPEKHELKLALGAYKTTIKLRRALKKAKSIVPVKEEAPPDEKKEETGEAEKEKIQIKQIQQQASSSEGVSQADIQNAIEQARALVAMEPHNEWAHYSLGSVLAQAGEFSEAIGEFKVASSLNPNNAIAWYALGLSFVRSGQLDEAVQALQQAIISVPDARLTSVFEEWNYKDSLAYFGLGDVYIRKGMFDEAIKIFQKGLLIDATSALAHFQLGTCYEVKEQYDLAVESFINCLSLNPNFSFAYSKLGTVYFKKNQLNEALVMLLKAVSYDNADSESYYFLGEIYVKTGKFEEAKYAYNMVLQLAPQDDVYYAHAQKALADLNTAK